MVYCGNQNEASNINNILRHNQYGGEGKAKR